MKKAAQNTEQALEAISKFFSMSGYESTIGPNSLHPLNAFIYEMSWDVLRLERRLRVQLFFNHKSKESKEGQHKHRRKISACFSRALYGKEDDRNKLSPSKLGGKLASLLSYFTVSPYKTMSVREQAAIFGGPVSTHARWRKDVYSELARNMGSHSKALGQKSLQARAIYSECQKGNRNRASKQTTPASSAQKSRGISPSKSGI